MRSGEGGLNQPVDEMLRGIKKKFATKASKEGKEPKPDKIKAASSTAQFAASPTANGSASNVERSTENNVEPRKRASSNAAKTGELPVATSLVTDSQPLTKADLLKPIPTFQDTNPPSRPNLFLHKLKLCQVSFDWSEEAGPKDQKAKEVKRQILLELVDYIGKNKNIFTEPALVEIVKMVSCNLFRALPPKQAQHGGETEEEDPVFEPSWPHLQIVYEFFLRFIVSSEVDVRTLKKHITGAFVLRILELFDSEDHRERDYLKTILHRIYAKFMSLRAFIRKAINNSFWVFIYDTEKHNGVAELLEILGSIINGFALPLKPEHKQFLKKVLTPMHKVKPLASFHQQLSYCVTQFVDKDPTLAVPVITGLLKYWPVTNSSKEVLFLNELEELLELTQPDEFKVLLPSLGRQLAASVGSPHFQVAERALFLWHNEMISGLFADHRQDLLPILYPVLHVNSQNHWNPTVTNLTYNVLKIFTELDSNLVEECSRNYSEDVSRQEAKEHRRREAWLVVADMKPAIVTSA